MKKYFSKFLSGLVVLAILVMPFTSLPKVAEAVSSINPNITITDINGTHTPPFNFSCPTNPLYSPVTVSGTATADAPPGQLDQYHVQILWGDTTQDNVTELSPFGGNVQGIATRSFSGTHIYNTGGAKTITIRVYHQNPNGNDNQADSVIAVQTCIIITPPNTAPVAVDDVETINEDTIWTVAKTTLIANDTDANNNTLSLTAVSNAVNGSVVIDGSNVVFTPTADFNGTASFEYTVSDGSLTDVGLVTVTVNPINDAPVALDDSDSTNEDTPVTTGNVLSNDTDIDGGTLSVSAADTTSANGGTVVNNNNGTFTYTPAANFGGSDTFNYTVSDGLLTDVGTVTITVSNTNDAPIATADSYSVNEDETLTVPASGVISNDTDAENNQLTAILVGTGVSNGTLALSADGSFTYTPNANFNGTDSFTYKANDGSANSSTVTVTITVNPVNDRPITDNKSFTTNEDTAYDVTLTGSDSDIPAQTLTFDLVNPPSYGTVVIVGNTATYTPTTNYNGPDSFTYTAHDGITNSLPAGVGTVSITVVPVNDAPTIILTGSNSIAITVGDAYAELGAVCSDVDNEGLLVSITGTVNTNVAGSYTITYTCTDAGNLSVSTTRIVTVQSVPAMCADGKDNDGDGKVDMNDPGCSSPDDNDETDPIVIPQGGGGGGGGGLLSILNSGGGNSGQVLGAATSCGIYADKFLRKGYKNDKNAVMKLQKFLNDFTKARLKEDGKFGKGTEKALKKFQLAHADKILVPWNLKSPTGIFYITTQTKVNNIMCPELNLPIPALTPIELNPLAPKKD